MTPSIQLRNTASMQRSLFAVSVALLLAATGAAAETVFKAKKIYTGLGVVSPASILVRDGKVVRVAESLDASAGVETIDLGDSVVMPGIVNFSTTLGLAGGDSEVTKEITPDFQPLRSIDWRSREFMEARANGVTSAGVFPGTEAVVSGLVSVVKTAGDKKDRVVKPDVALAVAMGVDPTNRNAARGRPDSIYMRQPTNRMGVVWLLRATLQKSQVDSKGELHAALQAKTPFFTTARVAADIEAVVRLSREFGFKPIIVGGEEAYQVPEVLAHSKTPVVLRTIGTASTGVGPEQTDLFWNQAGVLHKAGVTVAIAGEQPLEMAKFAVRYGLPADVAMQAITATPAKLLGVDSRVGTLADGKDADFVVLSGEPFEFTTRIKDVFVDGRGSTTRGPAPRGPLAGRPTNSTSKEPTNAKAKTTPKD
jgi:imidazolonepropionase-like amidohydrolase